MFPTWTEAKPFMERFGTDYLVVQAGIGPVECAARTAALISRHHPAMIILAGIAGAYSGCGIGKGYTVLVSRENMPGLGSVHDGTFKPLPKSTGAVSDNHYDCPTPLPAIFPHVVSNSLETPGAGYFNHHLCEAQIENMEGAAFFAVCSSLGVPCIEIRTISNIVGEPVRDWIITEAVETLATDVVKLVKESGY